MRFFIPRPLKVWDAEARTIRRFPAGPYTTADEALAGLLRRVPGVTEEADDTTAPDQALAEKPKPKTKAKKR